MIGRNADAGCARRTSRARLASSSSLPWPANSGDTRTHAHRFGSVNSGGHLARRRPPSRRRHDTDSKARVVAPCAEPGASVAQVAMANDLNANLVHKWRRGTEPATPGGRVHRAVDAARGKPGSNSGDPHRTQAQRDDRLDQLADRVRRRMRGLAAGTAEVIRIDAVWLAVQPLDMRAGSHTALGRRSVGLSQGRTRAATDVSEPSNRRAVTAPMGGCTWRIG